jgi:hypothetical protein
MTIRTFLMLAGSLLAGSQLQAQFSIVPGNLYVYQISDGTAPLTSSGNSVFIDQFSTAGSLLNQVALPNSSAGAFIASGNSATEGSLALSPAGDSLTFMGYNTPLGGTGALNGRTAATANRDVATVSANGTFSLAATSVSFYGPSAGAGRGAVTDGNGNYWVVGVGGAAAPNGAGLDYYGNSSAAAQVAATGSARSIGIYGGSLYYSAGTAILSVSAAMGAATPTTVIADTGGTPDGFVFNPGMTTAYIAEGMAGKGIERWDLIGGTWTLSYSLGGTGGFGFVTADFSGANPVIYATTLVTGTAGGNKLEEIVDTGASSATTVLSTAGANLNYNGIAFDVAAVPEPCDFALLGLGMVLFLKRWRRTTPRP